MGALLACASVAFAADQFPADSGTFKWGTAESNGNLGVWIVLADGNQDSVSTKATEVFFSAGWEIRFSSPLYGPKQPCESRDEVNGRYKSIFCKGEGGSIHLRMGDLADTFVAGDLNTTLDVRGEDGGDYIRTGRGKDFLDGGTGNDVLRSGDGADRLWGLEGDDILDGGGGADVFECGTGTGDKAQYQGRTSKVTVTLDSASNDGESGEADNVKPTCENIEGWGGGDSLTGSSDANRIWGNAGNDTINGGGGNDKLYGGPGNDALTGGAGADTLTGEAGNDVIKAKGDGSVDTIFCGDGVDVVYADSTDRWDIVACEEVVN